MQPLYLTITKDEYIKRNILYQLIFKTVKMSKIYFNDQHEIRNMFIHINGHNMRKHRRFIARGLSVEKGFSLFKD